MALFTKEQMLERVAQVLKRPELAEYDAGKKLAKLSASVDVQLVEVGDPLENVAGWGLGIHVIHYDESMAVLKPADPLYAAAKADLAAIAAAVAAKKAAELIARTDQIVHELNAVLRKAAATP